MGVSGCRLQNVHAGLFFLCEHGTQQQDQHQKCLTEVQHRFFGCILPQELTVAGLVEVGLSRLQGIILPLRIHEGLFGTQLQAYLLTFPIEGLLIRVAHGDVRQLDIKIVKVFLLLLQVGILFPTGRTGKHR